MIGRYGGPVQRGAALSLGVSLKPDREPGGYYDRGLAGGRRGRGGGRSAPF